MSALTITAIVPIQHLGEVRRRVYSIAGVINDGDTITITDLPTVWDARLVPGTAAGVGLSFNPAPPGGRGSTVITVRLTASVTGALLTVTGAGAE